MSESPLDKFRRLIDPIIFRDSRSPETFSLPENEYRELEAYMKQHYVPWRNEPEGGVYVDGIAVFPQRDTDPDLHHGTGCPIPQVGLNARITLWALSASYGNTERAAVDAEAVAATITDPNKRRDLLFFLNKAAEILAGNKEKA